MKIYFVFEQLEQGCSLTIAPTGRIFIDRDMAHCVAQYINAVWLDKLNCFADYAAQLAGIVNVDGTLMVAPTIVPVTLENMIKVLEFLGATIYRRSINDESSIISFWQVSNMEYTLPVLSALPVPFDTKGAVPAKYEVQSEFSDCQNFYFATMVENEYRIYKGMSSIYLSSYDGYMECLVDLINEKYLSRFLAFKRHYISITGMYEKSENAPLKMRSNIDPISFNAVLHKLGCKLEMVYDKGTFIGVLGVKGLM